MSQKTIFVNSSVNENCYMRVKQITKGLKTLLPSLKERKRYLVFEVISKNGVKSFSSVSNTIWQKTKELIGEIGIAKSGIWLLPDKWNEKTQQGVIKVSHKYTDHVKASLATIKEIEGKKVIVKSVGLSGILKKAQEKFMAM